MKALGSGKTTYTFDHVTPEVLERFACPESVAPLTLYIKAPEFTSLCPITSQPDFATIVVSYEPDRWCVESKSLKLYLGSFRMVGEFHEACVARICKDLVALLDPKQLMVRGEFTPRGGISFWPTANYARS